MAIGGISRGNITEVMAAGAVSAAVISAVTGAENIKEAAHQIVDKIGATG